MFKNLLTTAIALIFLITGVMSIVGAGQLANIGLEKALGVEECMYGRPTKVDTDVQPVCEKDTNGTKRDIAHSLSMLLVSLPAAVFAYRKVNKNTQANKG